jgi:hypothetical protein
MLVLKKDTMKRNKYKMSLFLLIGLIFTKIVFVSCVKEKVPIPIITTTPSDPNCPDTVHYSSTINQIMIDNCTGCHNTSNPMGGFDLSNYAGVSQNTSAVLNSVLATGNMPQGNDKLPDSTVQKIKCWINQGAKNN